MFKTLIISYAIKNGAELVSDSYKFFASKIKLSDKRRATIEERRAQLKVQKDDPQFLQILIEELLAYKPNQFTVDDRYFQLEQVLDAIDNARDTKKYENIIPVCEKIIKEMSLESYTIKNIFLERLISAINQIKAIEMQIPKAKL